ncbi:MAG: hypothetical protein U0105_25975 [Candidatus Obscuribacterales bacterium]
MNATAELLDARPTPKQLQPKHSHMELHQPQQSATNTALSYGLFWWACVDDRSIIKACTRAASKISKAFLSFMTVLYGLTQTHGTTVPLTEFVFPERNSTQFLQSKFNV